MTSEIVPEPTYQLPASNNIARRSVSIFSRKGTDTPIQPSSQSMVFSSSTVVLATPSSPSGSSSSTAKGRSKRWTLTGRVESKIPEGTILRAVPRDAPKTNMTPLEREMATSPNDEILRAIGMVPESAPTSPVGLPSPLCDITNTSPQRYYSKRTKKNQQDVLGVWRDGKVQWEKENRRREDSVARPKTSDGTRRSDSLLSSHSKARSTKPKIQVIIPENHSARRPFSFMPFFQNGPLDRANSFEISPPSITSGRQISSSAVSDLASPTIHKPIPYRPFQPITTAIDMSPAFSGSLLPERPPHTRSASANSSGSDSEGDDSSSLIRSSRSSMTSLGVHNDEQSQIKEKEDEGRRASDSSESSFTQDDDNGDSHKILVQTTIVETTVVQVSPQSSAPQGPRMADLADLMRTPSTKRPTDETRKKRLSSSRGQQILARINSKDQLKLSRTETPSLEEAVRSLETSLSSFSCENALDGADAPEVVEMSVAPSIPEILVSPVDVPPALPRKSSKRTRLSFPPSVITPAPAPPEPVEPVIQVTSSSTYSAAMQSSRHSLSLRRQQIQSFRRDRRESHGRLRRRSSVRSVLSLVREEDEFPIVDSNAAETVVFQILSHSQSMDDIFNAALITRGFHQIFKRHELELMRSTLRKQCAPHWEYRESTLSFDQQEDDSAAPTPEYTPASYYKGYKADLAIITPLKHLIQLHCGSLLRAETLSALQTSDSSRVDAALFRIWTFCQIFGSNKGREDDLEAQMDWLRGGTLAHQDSCSSTISGCDSFYISNVLLSAPEHFAKGNAGGLSAEDLYDMLEVWSCLTKLTSGVVGKTQLARQFGVFDETDVMGGDIDGEEAMLEEWHAHLLTLGLSPIMDIITLLTAGDEHTAFAVAQYNGLTCWAAPYPGSSRSTFLHEPVTRIYEERLCEAFSPDQTQLKELRSLRRSRDSQFHQRRLSVQSARRPERTTSLNREWGSFRSAYTPSNRGDLARTESSAGPSHSSRGSTSLESPVRTTPIIRRKSLPRNSSIRSSYFPSTEPIAEELPPYDAAAERERESARIDPVQRALLAGDPGQNSVEKAIFRIMEMGFSSDDAKGALKITDMGDGLRVDRAVEYLMRSKGFH